MKKDIKILMSLNLLNYLNNFVFSFFYTYARNIMKEHWVILGLWALTPYLIITITTFILATDNKVEYKIFKKEAIVDFIVRFISCGVVFQEFSFEFLSKEYIMQQFILALLFVINVMLEYKMYKKAEAYNYVSIEVVQNEKISEEEKQNIANMGKATTLGVISIFVVAAGAYSIAQTKQVSITQFSRFVPIMISVAVFIWFVQASYKKCNLFYLDKAFTKRIFIVDAIWASIGSGICFLTGVGFFESKSIIYYFSVLIGILSLYPTIHTNRKMGLRYRKVVKILGDDFEYYFTLKR